jgi:hypothetical protein
MRFQHSALAVVIGTPGRQPRDPNEPLTPLEPLIVGSAKHCWMLRRFQKIKRTILHLRAMMAKSRRISQEQDDHMHRMEIVMESLANNFLDRSLTSICAPIY